MTGPAASRTRPPLEPLRGVAWLAARLSLAGRRSAAFLRWWLGVGSIAIAVGFLLPLAQGDRGAESRLAMERAAADTLRQVAAMAALVDRQRYADSTLAAALELAAAAPAPARAPQRTPVADARIRTLQLALERAQREQTTEAFLALADADLIRYGPRLRAIADSLAQRPGADEEQRLGRIVAAIAQNRLAQTGATPPTVPPVSAQSPRPLPDTATLRARSLAVADSIAAARRALADAQADLLRREAEVAASRDRGTPPPSGLWLLAVVGIGVALRVGSALLSEMQRPTLASALDAERTTGANVLTMVRVPMPEGPPRFTPGGVDPFRVLYLSLTSTGTRARSLIVTGEDPSIVGAAAARLAIAAAADHRATLIADLDAEQVTLSRIFRDQTEPGLGDVLSGAFSWGAVARPVGSSDGLTLALVPAGTTRAAVVDAESVNAAAESLGSFRETYEFTILAASRADLALARSLVPGAPVVLCGSLGVTEVQRFAADAAHIQEDGERLHSIILWDATLPVLPSRAALAAELSKRKGRTPGGSFKAVQEAINKPLK